MRHNDDTAPPRMNKYVVRAPDPFQDPAALLQLADKVGAPDGVYYAHGWLIRARPAGKGRGAANLGAVPMTELKRNLH
jgi:hypothetical protein